MHRVKVADLERTGGFYKEDSDDAGRTGADGERTEADTYIERRWLMQKGLVLMQRWLKLMHRKRWLI
jgi:hypothetical protein